MEKVKFVDPDTGEALAFFVVEETKVGGTHYLLATEEEDGDCDAYILKEVETKDEESVYVLVEDDTELSAIGKCLQSCSTTRTLHFKRQIIMEVIF